MQWKPNLGGECEEKHDKLTTKIMKPTQMNKRENISYRSVKMETV